MKKILIAVISLVLFQTSIAKEVSLNFDNSLPGKWIFIMDVSSPDDKNYGQSTTSTKCLSKEDIEKSKKMTFTEKFKSPQGMTCKNVFSPISDTYATFTMMCEGVNSKEEKLLVHINGTLKSEEKENLLNMEYKMIKNKEKTFVFTVATKSTFVSESCK